MLFTIGSAKSNGPLGTVPQARELSGGRPCVCHPCMLYSPSDCRQLLDPGPIPGQQGSPSSTARKAPLSPHSLAALAVTQELSSLAALLPVMVTSSHLCCLCL